MELQYLPISDLFIFLELVFVGALILFLIINKDFTLGIYVWLLSVLFFRYNPMTRMNLANSMLPDISIGRILFIFLVFMFVINFLMKKYKIFTLKGIEYSMLFFCLAAIGSMIGTGSIIKSTGGVRMGTLFSGYAFPFFMFFLSQNFYDCHRKREAFVKFIILIGFYLSLTAIFEHFHLNMLIFPKQILDPSFGLHHERARGIFGQAAVNGTLLGFVLIASLYFLLNLKSKFLWKFCSCILLILTPLAIFFTYTRAAWLAAILGFSIVMIFYFRTSNKKLILVTFLMFVIILSSIAFIFNKDVVASNRAGQEQPIYDRLNLYAASINMFIHKPVFGVGFGRFTENLPNYMRKIDHVSFRYPYVNKLDGHDSFIDILAEMGLVGFGLMLGIYFLILFKSIKLYRRFKDHPEDRHLVVIFWGFMVAYIVNAIFIEMRYFEFVNSLFFIFSGIIYGWERRCNEKIVR